MKTFHCISVLFSALTLAKTADIDKRVEAYMDKVMAGYSLYLSGPSDTLDPTRPYYYTLENSWNTSTNQLSWSLANYTVHNHSHSEWKLSERRFNLTSREMLLVFTNNKANGMWIGGDYEANGTITSNGSIIPVNGKGKWKAWSATDSFSVYMRYGQIYINENGYINLWRNPTTLYAQNFYLNGIVAELEGLDAGGEEEKGLATGMVAPTLAKYQGVLMPLQEQLQRYLFQEMAGKSVYDM